MGIRLVSKQLALQILETPGNAIRVRALQVSLPRNSPERDPYRRANGWSERGPHRDTAKGCAKGNT